MIALPECFLRLPIAHRALHDVAQGRQENSISAIQAAIDADYAIEIDIQMSKDGHAMVFHDYDLGRLTFKSGAVLQHTKDQLVEFRLKNCNETIPTFAQVLSLVAGRVPLLVEIKDQDGIMGHETGPLERAIAADLQGYAGDVAVMSFNPHSVAWMKRLLPNIPRGLTTGPFRSGDWVLLPTAVKQRLRKIPDFERFGASFISHNVRDLKNSRVSEIKGKGCPVLCWTVKDEATEMVARRIADNITFEGYLAKHLPT